MVYKIRNTRTKKYIGSNAFSFVDEKFGKIYLRKGDAQNKMNDRQNDLKSNGSKDQLEVVEFSLIEKIK